MSYYFSELPLLDEVDVLVVGAGSAAGCTAAIAAAQTGARTMLVERYGYAGGISTGVLDTFYGFYTPGIIKKVVGGIPDRVVARLQEQNMAFTRPNTYGAGTGITYNPETLKMVWEDMAEEAGVQLLYHSFCTDVITAENGQRVQEIVVDGKRGLMRIRARQIIDASGDADVCYRAGGPFEKAGEIEAAQTLTTTFRLANVDVAKARAVPKKELHARMHEANASGKYRLPREEGSIHVTPLPGVMHAIMTRLDGYDPTDPVSLTQAEIEGRRQVREYVRFLVDCIPGYENARLVALSTQIGIRESRRVYGEYRLTVEDVLGARKFPDTIGQCGAPVEDHHGGKDTKWRYIPESGVYDIPFRTLIPLGLANVLVAGRCFSATHEAHASCRSMGQCMAMGQAAGTAAALCVQQRCDPRDLSLEQLQQRLVEDGAILYDSQHVILADEK
ncbi:MAG: FAD-dependent oxidoreductase [Ktedonobacteraceae bacterium]|nr:FAD-dependent oxidoreductase [Ktedonobacteraceae bacterium]